MCAGQQKPPLAPQTRLIEDPLWSVICDLDAYKAVSLPDMADGTPAAVHYLRCPAADVNPDLYNEVNMELANYAAHRVLCELYGPEHFPTVQQVGLPQKDV